LYVRLLLPYWITLKYRTIAALQDEESLCNLILRNEAVSYYISTVYRTIVVPSRRRSFKAPLTSPHPNPVKPTKLQTNLPRTAEPSHLPLSFHLTYALLSVFLYLMASPHGSVVSNSTPNSSSRTGHRDNSNIFQCGTCFQSYTRLDHLARHVRSRKILYVHPVCLGYSLNTLNIVDTQEKPYRCGVCNKRFGRR
jgi:hypothetical protein